MTDSGERVGMTRKYSQTNKSSQLNHAMSVMTENEEKRTHISFADWLNELEVKVSNSGSKNNPFKQSFVPCPQSATVNGPARCFEPGIPPQIMSETNPFKSVVESEFTCDSRIDTPCYIQSTPANLNYYPQTVYKDLTAKPMSPINRFPHESGTVQHSVPEAENKTAYMNADESCFPEFIRHRLQGRKPRQACYDLSSDSGEECSTPRERIPTLRPGQFDGSMSWREFLNRFEDCARANHWSERTMTVQMRFCLVGAAGAVIHKNPRSGRWDYARIVEEMDAAYGPSSEHAAAIGIELRQRVRKAGEPLHVLRDDIYEKVSIVYADRSEREQDSISVEVFTNAMGDADIVQRLLEERPRTLCRAYDIAHRYETTRRTAASVTQLMQSATRPMERRARAAAVRECPEPSESEGEGSVSPHSDQRQKTFRMESKPRQLRFNKRGKINWEEIVCHNCQGIGHMRRNCPSPRLDLPRVAPVLHHCADIQPTSTVLQVKGAGPEMCIHTLLYSMELCALLDSGARRNVLPRHCYETIHEGVRPPLELSTVQALQGIGPINVNVLGEVHVPIQVGTHTVSVNFIVADVTEDTETILGHPFLEQARARLDFGSQKIVLFGEQIPYFNPKNKPRVHIVRIARTAVLEAGREYIVPGNAHFREHVQGNVLLSPTKGFMEKHRVLVARIVVDAQPNKQIPIRLYNPGTIAVQVRKGAIAGFLQPANVVKVANSELPTASPTTTTVPSHLQSLYAESIVHLGKSDQEELAELLSTYGDVFSAGPMDLGRTNLVQHDIQTRPCPPVKQQPRRMAFEKQRSADEQIQQNLDTGLAAPSHSSWASPIVMVRKKDQTYRLCVDYRILNERTIKDAYPLPRIQDTLDTLSMAKWFSTLDLASGYWQVELTPRARQAAAFCSRKGLFEWNVMPFGLCNAPATFQRLMDRVLAGLQWEICLVYLDDIIVLGKDAKEMIQRLAQVFERLRQANLKLKPAKCCLFRRQVIYLGHVVSEEGIGTDPQKVEKIREWPQPTSVNEIRQFVGLASYYRRFVRDFATVAKPLHDLLRKNARFQWTPESNQAFEKLKELLTTTPVLGYPMDHGDLILDTDASNFGIGAVLSQLQHGKERVLAYGSRGLTLTERNYCTTRRELLAVVEFSAHFRQYLLGRPFVVRTDHSSLQWLINMKEPEGQLARWLEKLGEYDFKVVHRPGRQHENADVLSRRPCRSNCACSLNEPSSSSPQVCHQAVQCDFDIGPGNDGTGNANPEFCPVGVVQPVMTASTASFLGWTAEELRSTQATDSDIAPIKRWIEEGGERPPWGDVLPYGPATKAYWSQWNRLYLKDGTLVRRFYLMEGPEFYPQVILPKVFRKDVMHQMHDGPVGGHFGVERTLSRLQSRYYWYQMREDVTLWCRTCASCAAKARPTKTPQAPMGTVRVGAPMERIAVDLMGPMNETERFNRYILVVQDYFTKWVEAYPLPNDQAVTVAEVIVTEWVCRYGAPSTLHSDQGSNFESCVFQAMCELLGIEKTRTTPFRPQSDGQVERFNATLQKILATTSERCHWDWDLMVPMAVMAYRATKHSSTGFTPNMMLFGRELTEPADLVVGLPFSETSAPTPPQYVAEMRERLGLAHQIAREQLGRSVERAKKQYDKNVARTHYKVGDAVWYLIKGTKRVQNKIRKFLPAYEGPYFILGHLDDMVYRIQKGPKTKVKVVHHDKLKPYHSRQPLENSWVFKSLEAWQPQEVPTPSLGVNFSDLDLGLTHLFAEEPVNDSGMEQVPVLDVPMTKQEDRNVQCGEGSTVQPSQPLTVNGQLGGRPQRVKRPPKWFGDWTD